MCGGEGRGEAAGGRRGRGGVEGAGLQAFLQDGDLKSMSFIRGWAGLCRAPFCGGVPGGLRLATRRGPPSSVGSSAAGEESRSLFRWGRAPPWGAAPAEGAVRRPLGAGGGAVCSLSRAEQASSAGHIPRWRAMALTSGRSSGRTRSVDE